METAQNTIDTTTAKAREALSTPVVSSGALEPSFVEALIDPVNVFRDPREVVEHPWFTDEEKRAILVSWARDELVIEQVASKVTPELRRTSRIDAVIGALSQFDAPAAGEYLSAFTSIRGACKRRMKRSRAH